MTDINSKALIYLISCALNEEKPERDRIEGADLDVLLRMSRRHSVAAMAADSVKKAGIEHEGFENERVKGTRKEILFRSALAEVIDRFTEAGIWTCPLKGSVLRDLYPRPDMRTMADCDVLFDPAFRDKSKEIMESLGYETQHFGGLACHDVYHKEPIYNFELHVSLFSSMHDEKLYEYYRDPEKLTRHTIDDPLRRYFDPEDLFVYMMAHEYKHYSQGGSGIRSLCDVYVFNRKYKGTLDRVYINQQLDKLGIREFAENNKMLADKLFSLGHDLSEEEEKMLDYMMTSGTYGTMSHRVDNSVRNLGGGSRGRRRYLMKRIFMPLKEVEVQYPFYYRHKVLLPVLPIHRGVKALVKRPKAIKHEIELLRKKKDLR